jgi:hypothetical protein
MKRLCILVFLAIILVPSREIRINPKIGQNSSFNTVPVAYAENLATGQISGKKQVLSASEVHEYIIKRARKKGVRVALASYIGDKEGQNNPQAIGDADYVCPEPKSPYYGQITPSYGLAQINLCWHPEVSIASATDLAFSVDWMLDQIIAGKQNQWSVIRFCRPWAGDNCP